MLWVIAELMLAVFLLGAFIYACGVLLVITGQVLADAVMDEVERRTNNE